MIYLVSNQKELFNNPNYEIISVDLALEKISKWDCIQFDTETSGRDPHLCKLLCAQFGNDTTDERIVIDCSCIDILLFKDLLESKLIIGQNLKFDLQFLYNYKIIPLNVYDTMIVEQLLYLGYPVAGKPGGISYSLHSIAERYLGIDIDKTVRGEIIWRGLDPSVVMYAAGDVTYLEKIRERQLLECERKQCVRGAELENKFVPVISYLEWCGVKLDEEKWRAKMDKDLQVLKESEEKLNQFVASHADLKEFVYYDSQGDLFAGFDLQPKVNINWSSSQQVIKIAKKLGFNTEVKDKKTGESKDSVLEKSLAVQKGICDEFLDLYFKYQEAAKLVSSFGQGHLNVINPITGRLYTSWKQLGAASGRMSCGSTQPNTDLAAYKHIPSSECSYPNLQQLPHDSITRACFVAEEGNNWVSCDYSAMEARLAGDIYNDQAVKDIFLKGIDSHSMYAKIFFKNELKDIDVNDIKKARPDLRNKAKGPEFALNFGGGLPSIMSALQCSREEAEEIIKNYEEGFKGTAEFAKRGSKFVRDNGYVLITPITGHKMYWWDWEEWKKRQDFYNSDDWDWNYYRQYHKGTGDREEQEVRMHYKAASKWDRMARNAPTQGTGACILKHSQILLFNWIIKNNYFGKIKLCTLVHDECNWEYPKELTEFPNLVSQCMERAASIYCKSLPIPAEATIGDHWIHE